VHSVVAVHRARRVHPPSWARKRRILRGAVRVGLRLSRLAHLPEWRVLLPMLGVSDGPGLLFVFGVGASWLQIE
jgi:hypothetical protein